MTNSVLPKLILASSSPRRKALLEQIGIIPAAIDPADIDESAYKDELPRPYALRMAREKAEAVAARHKGSYILTGDTVVAVGRRILPKAEVAAEARTCLALLQGRRHKVLTAVALVTPAGQTIVKLSESVVSFRAMSEAEREAYISTGEWQGKAGGYGYQGKAAQYIQSIRGSSSGIIGLPLYEVSNLLRSHGYPV